MTVLLLFLAVPITCFVHLIDIVLSSKLCVLGSRAAPVMLSDYWFGGIPGADNQIRLVEDLLPEGTCGKGVQVFTGWEFSLVWAAIAASLVMTLLLPAAGGSPFTLASYRNATLLTGCIRVL